jgi:hypothetical protein
MLITYSSLEFLEKKVTFIRLLSNDSKTFSESDKKRQIILEQAVSSNVLRRLASRVDTSAETPNRL